MSILAAQAMPVAAGVVAARAIPAGAALTLEDLEPDPRKISGNGSADASAFKDQARLMVGQIAVRPIPAGRPVTTYTLRPPYKVVRGQDVVVVFQDAGLQITANGKAMNNASENQSARVTVNGKPLQGVADSNGRILIGSGQ